MPNTPFFSQLNNFYHVLYTRCRQLNARLAIVGTKLSANIMLGLIKRFDIPLAGVYEFDATTQTEVSGIPVQPVEELKNLRPDDIIIIASSALPVALADSLEKIRALCPTHRVLPMQSLLDLFMLQTELKEPLDFHFDDFLFGRGMLAMPGEHPHWHAPPPGVDFSGKVVLELGPCEGNNSVMLMQQYPKKVIALEARPLNYAKCAVVRSIYDWPNYSLHLGDMHLFPNIFFQEKIDIIYCSGVHYHSDKPWWLLETCLRHCDTMILCGHVSSPGHPLPFGFRKVELPSGVYEFEIYPEGGWKDQLAGLTGESLWFKEEDLPRFFGFYGFDFRKYDSKVTETGYWIFSVVTRRKGTA